ncbi:MAG: hypothetical protein AAGM38_17195 [Pseudomonadota bacterium]
MSSRNIIAAALLPIMLSGCGFEPIAATKTGAVGEQDLSLSQLSIDSDDERFSYRVRQELLRSISIDPEADQTLRVSSKIDREGLAIEQDDAVTRLNLIARTEYALREAAPEPDADGVVSEAPPPLLGSTRVVTAVNTTASQFAATVSRREAVERLASETALRIITFLRVNRSNEDGDERS